VQDELAKIRPRGPGHHAQDGLHHLDFTQQQYKSSIEALIEGAVLAVVIVMLFLRDWRATVIAAMAIPLAALPTFAFMQWFGFTLNQMTLLALSLITGGLVDDHVEVEKFAAHEDGKSAYRAAMDAADEIGLAVVACSAPSSPVSGGELPGRPGRPVLHHSLHRRGEAVFMSLLVARLISPLMPRTRSSPRGAAQRRR